MKFYQEITIIDHAEISSYFIWSKLYGQLHIAFSDNKDSSEVVPYGLSFPQYAWDKEKQKGHLGKKLRVFAPSESQLQVLDIKKWLSQLTDYVHITSIRNVPEKFDGYAIYTRKHAKGENRMQQKIGQYAQFYAAQHNISYEDALKRYDDWQMREISFPYVQMKSLTNHQRFKLFIQRQKVEQPSELKEFTTYGLSQVSTVPEF